MIITLYINRTNTQNAASFKEKGKTKSQYESKKKRAFGIRIRLWVVYTSYT